MNLASSYAKKLMDKSLAYRELTRDLETMNQTLSKDCTGENPELSLDLLHLVENGGKRLRPSLAWMCARMGQEKDYEILPLMCMLEQMHTASLVHDDVVDQGYLRRGIPTINSLRGNEQAIMAGDFILARAMEYLPIYKGSGINEALSWLSIQMSMGELDQMKDLFDVKAQTVERYFERINQKTAYFIATSCYTGALAGRLPEEQAKALREYGLQIGIAFQLKDDVLDFVGKERFGKQLGQDLRRGLFTLPACYALQHQATEEEIRLAEKQDKTDEEFEQLFHFICKSDGVAYTDRIVAECSEKAIQCLNVFEPSEEKKLLEEMAQALCRRRI